MFNYLFGCRDGAGTVDAVGVSIDLKCNCRVNAAVIVVEAVSFISTAISK